MPAGFITQDELEKALKNCGGYKADEIKEILANTDKNKDGSIDYGEFVEMMQLPSDEAPIRRRKQAIKF
jgi:Ca2+-binding EF-hand superfamily protein